MTTKVNLNLVTKKFFQIPLGENGKFVWEDTLYQKVGGIKTSNSGDYFNAIEMFDATVKRFEGHTPVTPVKVIIDAYDE